MHIEVYNTRHNENGYWFWRIVAGNKKAIAKSDAYVSERNATDGANLLNKHLKKKLRVIIA